MIRAFVALPLPELLCQRLMLVQALLHLPRPVRAVPPQNLHLTLAFAGEQPTPVLEDLHHALEGLRAPGFDLALRGVEAFGGRAPRSVHAGVEPCPGLERLQRKVLRAMEEVGLAPERRRFTPHVTLARLDWRRVAEADRERFLQAIVAQDGFRAGPARIEAFALYRSHLGREGPHYDELARYGLETASA
ncbi:MAG: RNA 2',3'-cyclic phosphodiesterase [Alkalilacustris sp.]